tara:strand:+ start:2279 stop:3247 length:969 start_codon:yes stop_codon:yes gene_type:complete
MIKPITLIIPSKSTENKITHLLKSITKQTFFPSEILLVNCSKIKYSTNKYFKNFCKSKGIKFKILKVNKMFPGAARNIGVRYSSNEIVAFLDINTIPVNNWLKNGYNLITKSNKKIIWGTTIYKAENYFEKITRATTYGNKKIVTIPGTILKKEIFNKIGLFLEHLRAGEDGDWFRRVKLHKTPSMINKNNLIYIGLKELTILKLLKKWHRNYSISKNLGHLKNQKEIYYFSLIIMILLIAFNWNAFVADWNMEKSTYLPHITKISLALMISSYIFLRGVFIPLKKGVKLNFLLPLNFIPIVFLSILIDLIKVIAFLFPKNN